jgi:tRNA pseudouridine38-40 synthase
VITAADQQPAARHRPGGPSAAATPSPGDAAPGGTAAAGLADQTGPADQELCRVRIDLGYDGAAFSGWARQPGRRTVQEVVEDALARALRLPAPASLTVAGRTDAGVHARGQVAHADLPGPCWAEAAPSAARRLARALPPDVRVGRIELAAPGFDARFSALSRRYSYRVCDDPAGPDPLRRHDTLAYRRPLDLPALNEAAALMLGEHDFAAFCRRRAGASTVRELRQLSWQRTRPAGAPSVLVATVVADAFCHSMVRALVGALLKVGEGARPLDWPAAVLAGRVRDPGAPVVPPQGLCLEEVRYPPPAELARRAQVTRQLRAAPAGPARLRAR